MEKAANLQGLRSTALYAKNFSNGLVSELANATVGALDEMDARLSAVEGETANFTYDEGSETMFIPSNSSWELVGETLVIK